MKIHCRTWIRRSKQNESRRASRYLRRNAKISGSLEGYIANFNTEVSEEAVEATEEPESETKDPGEPVLAENV